MQKPPRIVKIDMAPGCKCPLSQQGSRLVESGYVSSSPKELPRITSAAINCSQSYQALTETIRKRFKGNFIREAQKAKAFQYGPFVPERFAYDIEEINKSRPVRSGGPMRPAYLRSADELRTAYKNEPRRDCGIHWSVWFGVYEPPDIRYAQKLVGYVNIKRWGELGLYSTILGHAEFLDAGIMPHLHLGIMRHLLQGDTQGIKWLMYAGWNDGQGKGLQLWKRKAGFEPVQFIAKEAPNGTTTDS